MKFRLPPANNRSKVIMEGSENETKNRMNSKKKFLARG